MTTNSQQHETRDLGLFGKLDATELRVAPEQPNRLIGYASVFNSLSADLGGFKERVLPGAFKTSLTNGTDIRALADHDSTKILGRTSNGTMRLSEDAVGLRVEIDLPEGVSYANDIRSLVSRGDIKGMSVGFRVPAGGQRFIKGEGGMTIRELTALNLIEASVTSIPAFSDTSVYVRSAHVDPSVLKEISRPDFASRRAVLRRVLVEG